MIGTQEAGKEENDETSGLANGTVGNCPLALASQEQKHDHQTSVPVSAFRGYQLLQCWQLCAHPQSWKLGPSPLSSSFSTIVSQCFMGIWAGSQLSCLTASDPTPQTKLRTWQPEGNIKDGHMLTGLCKLMALTFIAMLWSWSLLLLRPF